MKGQEETNRYIDKYSEEVLKDYKCEQAEKNRKLFVSQHSDTLNIEVADSEVKSKLTLMVNDIILQVRGSVTSEEKLKEYMNKHPEPKQKPILLSLSKEKGIILMPTNLSKELIRSSLEKKEKQGNCEIVNHFNSKLLVKMTTLTPRDERLCIGY